MKNIKAKTVNNKIKVITLNSQKGTKNTRAYWRMLKILNGRNKYPLRISNPNHSLCFIEDPKEIARVLGDYCRNLGTKDSNIEQSLTEKLKDNVNDLHNYTGVLHGLTDVTADYEKL